MLFAEAAEITVESTVVVIARFPGQVVRLGGSEETSPGAGSTLRIKGQGTLELSQGYWDLLTIVPGDYSGPPFSGDSPDEGPAWLPGSGNSGCKFVGNPTWIANSGVNGGQIGYAATLKEVGDWQL